MYFKKIYMHGFKSFAEPVTIEFHPGITCIVGPNGSGKSNISDAIRWVLGEQSAKTLRGGKMQEVIFSGTENKKSRGMAEVIVTIDNSTGLLPIEYSEVAITRRMYRSGESEYYINNNQCRLKDIRELIMDTGIGVEGYSIIGQGKIADIVNNKTESRREIFEEAAGVVTYRTRKHEAERKLESASGNLDRVNDIIGEIEGRIGTLKEESEKASEYVKLRDRFKELEVNISLRNIDSSAEKADELKNEIAGIVKEQEEVAAKKSGIDESLRTKREQIRNLEEISSETGKRLMELIDEINSMVNMKQINEERLVSIDRDKARIEAELKDLEEKFDRENDNFRETEKTEKEIQSRLDVLRQELVERSEGFREQSQELTGALTALDEAKEAIFEHSRNASQKRAEAQGLSGLEESLIRREESIKRELAEEDGDTDLSLRSLDEERDKAGKELEAAREEVERLRTELEEERKSRDSIASGLDELRLSLSRNDTRINTIEEMENSYEGFNNAVRYIMKMGLKGIHGTAADLMHVREGYETAIETAMGASMSNILCDDDEVAKKAVAMLKEAKAGRLTLIPVSSIRGYSRGETLDREKGFLGYANELVSYDSRYREAYSYLLGRTIIVDNIDNAVKMSKLARQGLRFVTLDGEIVNTAGTITGGRFKNRTASILERKAEVERLKSERDEQIALIAEREKFHNRSVAKVKVLEEDLAKAGERTAEIEKLLAAKDNEADIIERTLKDREQKHARLNEELEEIAMRRSQSVDMIRELESEAVKADKAGQEAEESISGLAEAYEAKKLESEKLSEGITDLRIKVTSCESELAGADRIMKRIRDSIDEITAGIDMRESALESLEEEREEIYAQNTSEYDAEEKRSLREALNAKAEEAKEKKRELDLAIEEEDRLNRELDSDMEALRERKNACEVKIARYETQIDSMKDRLWDNFQMSYIQALGAKDENFVMAGAVKENREIKARMAELGDVNIGAIEEYASVKDRYEFLTGQREDIQKSLDDLNAIITDMDKVIKERFKDSFDKIAVNFEKIFVELFGGGSARLILSDPETPLETDIEIVAQPPGKRLQNINLLSGGEKTMTAIAMMFAVLKTKPTPFCILDEVEASLDDANIERFAQYLKEFKETQFALVTHQKATMEYADVLYGVTMPQQGVSQLLSLKLSDDIEGL